MYSDLLIIHSHFLCGHHVTASTSERLLPVRVFSKLIPERLRVLDNLL